MPLIERVYDFCFGVSYALCVAGIVLLLISALNWRLRVFPNWNAVLFPASVSVLLFGVDFLFLFAVGENGIYDSVFPCTINTGMAFLAIAIVPIFCIAAVLMKYAIEKFFGMR